MRKLTDKIKYSLDGDGGAVLYAKHKESGRFKPFGVVHVRTLDFIKENGITEAISNGLIVPTKGNNYAGE